MARRYDPERRQRIVDAAVRVVAERGVGALSHRVVAAEADVPLGSTTYHFTGRDELLLAALRQVNDAWLARFAGWVDAAEPDRPLAPQLAGFVHACLTDHRNRTELEYELYVAGLRHPAVRPLAAECVESMVALVRRRLVHDEATARALVALADGLLLQLLLTGRPYDESEAVAAFARLLPDEAGGA
ncbi:TetR family transcriptional regulator [Streptomyces sp. B6B3]|uniref:TetR/AcrR family transcriptional regulator n=1 Tax=Streptomyces sp. B6B3 TaxID=3153570 RepID=UPI00325D5175